MNLKLLVTAVTLGVLTLNAQASSTNWGLHDDVEIGVGFVSPGSFADTFSFSINTNSTVVSTTVANNLGGTLNITGGKVELFKEAGAVDQLLGTYSFDGTTGDTSHAFLATTAGAYYYSVTGSATGSKGGFYSISSSAAPVPEPDVYMLMLTGLAVAGGVYRRRKSQ